MTRDAAVCLGRMTFGYETVLGARISRDPLEDAEINLGPNLYGYVFNNPVRLYDPLGLQPGFGSPGAGSLTNEQRADLYGMTLDEYNQQNAADSAMLKAANDMYVDVFTTMLGPLTKASKVCKAGVDFLGNMLKGKSAKDAAIDTAKNAVKDAVKDKAKDLGKTAAENLAPPKK